MLQNLPTPPQPSSALARPLDPRYPSNAIVAAGSALTFILFAVYNRFADQPLPAAPFSAALAVFLAWAIAREIDPDRNSAAYSAMVVAFVGVLFLSPSPLFGFGMLIASRLISGTVGLRLGKFDLAVIVGLGALLGSGANSVAAVPAVGIATLVIDRFSARSWVTAVGTIVAGVAAFFVFSPELLRAAPTMVDAFLAFSLIGVVAVAVPAAAPVTRTDIKDRDILAWRVSVSRLVVAGSIGLTFILGGSAGIQSAFPVAGAALLAVGAADALAQIRIATETEPTR